MNPKPTLNEVVALYSLGLLNGAQIVEFAVQALESGMESKSLSLLAGESNPILSEIIPLFESLLRELGLSKPDSASAQLVIAHYYAKAIRDKVLTPYEGARKIWKLITDEIENPSQLLMSFVGPASEIEELADRYVSDEYDPKPLIERYERDILKSAEELLKISDPAALSEKK